MKVLSLVSCVVFASISFALPIFAGDIQEGLIGWWKLDETSGATAANSGSVGADADGELGGVLDASNWVEGKAGGALDVTDGWVGCGTEVQLSGIELTISLWAKFGISGDKDNRVYLVGRMGGGGDRGTHFWVTGEGSIQTGNYDPWFGPLTEPDTVKHDNSTWYHLAYVRADGIQNIYVDGVEHNVGTARGPWSESSQVLAFHTGWSTGVGLGAEGPATFDDIRVYDKALTKEEIQQVIDESLAVSPSGKLAVTWAEAKSE